ncbi:MAG: succinylglutamate desuccinylase [Myxococcota bacterium]
MSGRDRELTLRVWDRDRDWPAPRVPDSADTWLQALGGPAWIRIAGRDPGRCRAVSTLLHGNEPSGLRALHRWLRAGEVPATDVVVFVGAVAAALEPPGFAYRVLPGERDLNRCWLPPHEGSEGALAREVLELFGKAAPEALLDVHNNTGHNPPYGVGPQAGIPELRLVALFGDRFVHSDLALASLVEGTRALCPSVTIECGRAGDPAADEVAYQGLLRFLGDESLGLDSDQWPAVQVLGDPVRVGVRSGVELAFAESPRPEADLTVVGDVDRHNFEMIPEGVHIGWVRARDGWPVQALGADGRDRSREMFTIREGMLETRVPMMPIMMTTDTRNALLDCLFYAVTPRQA